VLNSQSKLYLVAITMKAKANPFRTNHGGENLHQTQLNKEVKKKVKGKKEIKTGKMKK
jgi:hypothetical protein